MSVKDEQTTNLQEENVVNEVETTELVQVDKEARKAKVVSIAKKVGKVAGVAAIGIVGFLLGRGSAGKSEYDDSNVIDVDCEVIDSDE